MKFCRLDLQLHVLLLGLPHVYSAPLSNFSILCCRWQRSAASVVVNLFSIMAPDNAAPEVLQVFSGIHLYKGTELQELNIFEIITFIKLGRKFGIPLEGANRMLVLALFPHETMLNRSPTDTNLWKPLSALEGSFACHPQYSQLVLSPFLSSSQKCARHQDYDLCLSESKIISMFRLPSQPLCVPKGTIILFYSYRLV